MIQLAKDPPRVPWSCCAVRGSRGQHSFGRLLGIGRLKSSDLAPSSIAPGPPPWPAAPTRQKAALHGGFVCLRDWGTCLVVLRTCAAFVPPRWPYASDRELAAGWWGDTIHQARATMAAPGDRGQGGPRGTGPSEVLQAHPYARPPGQDAHQMSSHQGAGIRSVPVTGYGAGPPLEKGRKMASERNDHQYATVERRRLHGAAKLQPHCDAAARVGGVADGNSYAHVPCDTC